MDRFRASFSQRRFYFLQRLHPDSARYVLHLAAEVTATLADEALLEALELLWTRHEALRTSLRMEAGELSQLIPASDEVTPDVRVVDVDGDLSPTSLERVIGEPFELDGRLARAVLVRSGERRLVVFSAHHAVADAISLGVLAGELDEVLSARSTGVTISLEEPELQFADFAEWERDEPLEEGLSYWRAALEDLPLRPWLGRATSGRGAPESGPLRVAATRLAERGRALGVTAASLASAAVGLALAALTGEDDIILAMPVATRPQRELERVVGPLLNTVPLRVRVADSLVDYVSLVHSRTLGAFAHGHVPYDEIRNVAGLRGNRDEYALSAVFVAYQRATAQWRCLRPVDLRGDAARFPVEFSFRDDGDRLHLTTIVDPAATGESSGARIHAAVDFALGLLVSGEQPTMGECASRIRRRFGFPEVEFSLLPRERKRDREWKELGIWVPRVDWSLLDRTLAPLAGVTASVLLRQADGTLADCSGRPRGVRIPATTVVVEADSTTSQGRPLEGEVRVHPAGEPGRYTVRFDAGAFGEATIRAWLSAVDSSSSAPAAWSDYSSPRADVEVGGVTLETELTWAGWRDKPALTWGEQTLSFAEVDARVSTLAAVLREVSGHSVGVLLPRTPALPVTLHAALRAGTPYVALEASYPDDRLQYILETARPAVIVTSRELVDRACRLAPSIAVVVIDEGGHLLARVTPSVAGDPLRTIGAYILFTSGSTGRPKGVCISRSALAAFVAAGTNALGITPSDRVLALTTVTFDISVLELILPLVIGAEVILASESHQLDPWGLAELIRVRGPSVIQATPTTYAMLETAQWSAEGVRTLLCGGEPLPRALADGLSRRCPTVWNVFGPTEATVWVTAWRVGPGEVRIGAPFAGTVLTAIDDQGDPVGVGAAGELLIGGPQLAEGYVARPDLTADRFGQFLRGDARRWYRTGDLARLWGDGSIELLGRTDSQVKLRGFRIELGEVEEALRECSAVREVAVVLSGSQVATERELVAWVTPAGAPEGVEAACLRHVAAKLPHYMCPDKVHVLPSLPRNSAGKVDRAGLAQRATEASFGSHGKREDVSGPAAKAWETVLGAPPDAPHTSFFAAGGHSLAAVRLVDAIAKETGTRISLLAFLQNPTLSGLDAAILGATEEDRGSLPEASDEPYPLTPLQRAYWLGRRREFGGGDVATHVYQEYSLPRMDTDRVRTALSALVARHGALRSIVVDGKQQVLTGVEYVLPVRESASDADDDPVVLAWREKLARRVPDPATWPLWHVALVQGPATTRVLLSFDVLFMDARSGAILFEEFQKLYQFPGRPLPPLRSTFQQHVLFMEAERQGAVGDAARRYWAKRSQELPPPPKLPSGEGSRVGFERRSHVLEVDTARAILEGATRCDVSSSAVVLAVFAHTVAMWAESQQFSLSVTSQQRHPRVPDSDRMIGDFTSLLLADFDLRAPEPFVAVARRVQQTLWDRSQHGTVGVLELVQLARTEGGPLGAGVPVVFTSTLGLERSGRPLPGVRLAHEEAQASQVLLECLVSRGDTGLKVKFDWREPSLSSEVGEAMFESFVAQLSSLASPDQWSAALPFILPRDQARCRRELNAAPPPPVVGGIADRLWRQLAAEGGRAAVFAPDRTLTRDELRVEVRRVAFALRRAGVGPGDRVAVIGSAGWRQIAAIIGVTLVGGAYVPVDASYPTERKSTVVEAAEVRAVLGEPSPHAPLVDPWAVEFDDSSEPLLEPVGSGDDLAYIIFTSGSTGTPKGVAMQHGPVLNTLEAVAEYSQIGPEDRVLALSSASFDLSVFDIFGVLGAGGALVVPDPSRRLEPGYWLELCQRQEVTLWNSVPALFDLFVDHLEARAERVELSLREVLLSGDWIPVNLPDRARARLGARITSLGGATEAAIWSIWYPIGEVGRSWPSIPYGRPMPGQSWDVVDEALRSRPDRVPGELLIGGLGLAREYHGAAELTAQRFITRGRQRHYRTGDMGRYLPGGVLEFLGRVDHQVKVGGHRIELGDIEAALSRLPGIRAGAVQVWGERNSRWLAAYWVADEDVGWSTVEAHLRALLPAYMVPRAGMQVAHWPLSSNGKVDRSALPAIDLTPSAGSADSTATGAIEAVLCAAFAEVLGRESFGARDNFFASGGDSILSIRARNAALRRGVEFHVPDLFELPTPAALATRSRNVDGAATRESEPGPYDLVPAVDRRDFPAEVEAAYPLSRLQLAFVYHSEVTPDYQVYVQSYLLSETYAPEAMRSALDLVTSRHEILRSYADVGGFSVPMQFVLRKVAPPLVAIDLSSASEATRAELLDAFVRRDQHRRFVWEQAPWLRATVHHWRGGFHITIAHAMLDGWAFHTVLAELLEGYFASAGGREPNLPPPPRFKYRTFVKAELEAIQSATARSFWAETLQTRGRVLGSDGSAAASAATRQARRGLTGDLLRGLQARAEAERVSLKAVLLAAHVAAVRALAGGDDVVTGTLTTGRPDDADAERTVGVFHNTLPLVVRVGECTWRELMLRVEGVDGAAFRHRHLPFIEIKKLGKGRELFDSLFVYTKFHLYKDVQNPNDRVTRSFQSDQTYNGLTLHFSVAPDGRSGAVLALTRPRSISEARTELALDLVVEALTALVNGPDEPARLVLSPGVPGVATTTTTKVAWPAAVESGFVPWAGDEEVGVFDGNGRLVSAGAQGTLAELRLESGAAKPGEIVHEGAVIVGGRAYIPRGASPMAEKAHGGALPEDDAAVDIGAILALVEEVTGERPGADDAPMAVMHSLQLIRFVARLRAAGFVVDSARVVFEVDSFADLGRTLGRGPVERSAMPGRTGLTRGRASAGQQRILLMDQVFGGGSGANVLYAARAESTIDTERLNAALVAVVDRHPTLRTRFEEARDGWVQVEVAPGDCHVDLESFTTSSREEMTSWLEAFRSRKFDPSRAPLVRAATCRFGDQTVVALVVHHSVTDGWSRRILLGDLFAFYGGAVTLPPLPYSYIDYSTWQWERLADGSHERKTTYWRELLEGAVGRPTLPTRIPRGEGLTRKAHRTTGLLPSSSWRRIEELARAAKVTAFAVVLAALGRLLGRVTNEEEHLIGSPVASREVPGSENLVGFFVNTLPFRLRGVGGPFSELVARAHQAIVGGLANSAIPFDHILEVWGGERDLRWAPLYQTMLTLHNEEKATEVGPVGLRAEESGPSWLEVDLSVELIPGPAGLRVQWEFVEALFETSVMSAWMDTLLETLERVAQAGFAAADATDLLDPASTETLDGWECGESFSVPASLGTLLRGPGLDGGGVAVIGLEAAHSRRDVLGLCGRLQAALNRWGPGPVAVLSDRVSLRLAAALAIVGAGRDWVPLDPGAPAGRLRGILASAGAVGVVADEPVEFGVPAVFPSDLDAVGDVEPPRLDGEGDVIIFTSGTTGTPKGVRLAAAGVAAHFAWMNQRFGLSPGDRTAAVTSAGFDVALWELLGAWTAGMAIVEVPSDARLEPSRLVRTLSDRRVTVLQSTPTTLSAWLQSGLLSGGEDHLRVLICGAERMPTDLAARVLGHPGVTLVNAYGPTESTIDASVWTVTHAEGPIPIGHPVAGRRVCLRDQWGARTPLGGRGEITVGGLGVARGYLDASADADAFTVAADGARFYRTGDMARWTGAGVLMYEGRRDSQVKVGGVRIEVGDVEAHLRSALPPDVEGWVVWDPAISRFRALLRGGEAVTLREVRRKLREFLPPAAIPVSWHTLERVPQTTNGKVDRARLLEAASERPTIDEGLASAETAARIAAVFADVLGLPAVDPGDSFFAVGGSSLRALEVTRALARALGLNFSLRDLFEWQSPGGLAESLATRKEPSSAASDAAMGVAPVVAGKPGRGPVVVTGASGFLGAHLVAALVERGHTVRAIVRHTAEADAEARGRATLSAFGLAPALEKIEWIDADLASSKPEDWAALRAKIEGAAAIVHTAAAVHLLGSYDALRPVNVLATLQLLDIAAKVGCRFHFISTDSVLDDSGKRAERPERLGSAYAKTKWAAEHLAERAGGATIHRMGNIGPSTVTGSAHPDDQLAALAGAALALGVWPRLPAQIAYVPVDLLARDIALSLEDGAGGLVAHPSSYAADVARLAEEAARLGRPSETLELGAWRSRVLGAGEDPRVAPAAMLLEGNAVGAQWAATDSLLQADPRVILGWLLQRRGAGR